jgi:hypothetical protein
LFYKKQQLTEKNEIPNDIFTKKLKIDAISTTGKSFY